MRNNYIAAGVLVGIVLGLFFVFIPDNPLKLLILNAKVTTNFAQHGVTYIPEKNGSILNIVPVGCGIFGLLGGLIGWLIYAIKNFIQFS